MSRDTHDDAPSPPATPMWSAGPARDALELIAEGVTELAGFQIAAISVARDDGQLELMAVAGDDEARRTLQGRRTPIAQLMAELDKADHWGLLRFVPHERLEGDGVGETWGYVPDIEMIDAEDAWHPMDLLIAPLYDEAGTLRGTLAIDVPLDGRRPGAAQRRVLQKYAEQAGRAVVTTLEREALAERFRLAEAARQIVRGASAQLTLEGILADSQQALVEGFSAHGLWLQLFEREGAGGSSTIYAADGPTVASTVSVDDELAEIARVAASRAWAEQHVEVIAENHPFVETITAQQRELVMEFLRSIGIASMLFVPLGAGPHCFGNLVLTRTREAPEWSEHEKATALDIGHDLGRAILNARSFEREHQLVEELQELDTYKSQLIATVSHELKNPLTAITGHLEILESIPDLAAPVAASVKAMDRGARRLGRVIDDLLLLSKVGDPSYPIIPVPVDMRRVLDDALDLSSVTARRKEIEVRVTVPEDGPVMALGDADELHRVCANLISNAVKYTPDGGTVTLTLTRLPESVTFCCHDEGIGISEEDQQRLFQEFFRSTNPEAVAQPGTGLGLAIVQRIVDRHGGQIHVASALGEGSTFSVTLPAAH